MIQGIRLVPQEDTFFYDVNAKLNHIINDNNRIFFSAYLGNDKFSIDNNTSYNDFSNQFTST